MLYEIITTVGVWRLPVQHLYPVQQPSLARHTPQSKTGKRGLVTACTVQRVVLRQDLVASNQIQLFSHMT